jgi:5'(3')-deoxyribonucleotidase
MTFRIYIDVDSTIADCLPYWLDQIGLETDVWARPEDIHLWDMAACSPLDRVNPKVIYGLLNKPGFNLEMPIMPGAREHLATLLSCHENEIYFATARSGAVCIDETYQWFAKHLPFVKKDQLIFTAHKHLLKGDVLIDDKAQSLVDFKKANPLALTIGIKYEYNKHLHGDHNHNFVDYGPDAWYEIMAEVIDFKRARGLE